MWVLLIENWLFICFKQLYLINISNQGCIMRYVKYLFDARGWENEAGCCVFSNGFQIRRGEKHGLASS
jgi:hypothetical protein